MYLDWLAFLMLHSSSLELIYFGTRCHYLLVILFCLVFVDGMVPLGWFLVWLGVSLSGVTFEGPVCGWLWFGSLGVGAGVSNVSLGFVLFPASAFYSDWCSFSLATAVTFTFPSSIWKGSPVTNLWSGEGNLLFIMTLWLFRVFLCKCSFYLPCWGCFKPFLSFFLNFFVPFFELFTSGSALAAWHSVSPSADFIAPESQPFFPSFSRFCLDLCPWKPPQNLGEDRGKDSLVQKIIWHSFFSYVGFSWGFSFFSGTDIFFAMFYP